VSFYGLIFDATAPGVVLAFLVESLCYGFIAGGLAVVLASVASARSRS
jgi:hypothetical protein